VADKYDLIVIGAGPGGYVAAIRAAQLGMKVACVDKNDKLGGTCLRVGCIPSKAMLESSQLFYGAKNGSLAAHGIELGDVGLDLESMLARKDKVVDQLTSGVAYLFKKNEITPYYGLARLSSGGKVDVDLNDGKSAKLQADNVLIATGSEPASIPGVELDGDRIGTSTEALSYPEAPEHLVVIGAGYIGLEMGSVWARLGSKVTVLEYLPDFLPAVDVDVAKQAQRAFKKQGLDIKLGVKVTGARVQGKKVTVIYENKGTEHTIGGSSPRGGAPTPMVWAPTTWV
jgi:dihydrolipoamide dehydrogenase